MKQLLFILISMSLSGFCQNGFSSGAHSQQVLQADTFTLYNGLKVYLLSYGQDSILNIRLNIDAGRKNETACEVGYSTIISELLDEYLKEKQFSCKIRGGETVLNGHFSYKELNAKMDLLSTTITRLSFTKEKMDPIVSSIDERYKIENMDSRNLSHVFKDLILYGSKHSLGRNYCQYQIQKVLPEELKEFYTEHYVPDNSTLIICGNFNVAHVKKIVARNFMKWRESNRAEHESKVTTLMVPEIKKKEIAFVNRHESKNYDFKWVLSAPSSTSSEYPSFLAARDLFGSYLIKRAEAEKLKSDSLNFEVSYTSDFIEINAVSGQENMMNIICFFDTVLQIFSKSAITEADLEETKNHLKTNCVKNNTTKTFLSFYDPVLYDFWSRKNYQENVSKLTIQHIQAILKKYFSPALYKLVIVGKEHLVSAQLNQLQNVSRYQTSDFETCDDACKEVVIIKCHCESCYKRGYYKVWRFNPSQKDDIKTAGSRAKFQVKPKKGS